MEEKDGTCLTIREPDIPLLIKIQQLSRLEFSKSITFKGKLIQN